MHGNDYKNIAIFQAREDKVWNGGPGKGKERTDVRSIVKLELAASQS